jgi:hypothetical protein
VQYDLSVVNIALFLMTGIVIYKEKTLIEIFQRGKKLIMNIHRFAFDVSMLSPNQTQ